MTELKPVERLIRIEALYTIFDVIRPADFYFPGESHDFWEMVYVCDGNVVATADERVYRLDSGKLIFHKPMEFHRIWSEGKTAPHLIILSFSAGGAEMARFENSCFALSPSQRKRLESAAAVFSRAEELKKNTEDPREYKLAAALTASLLESFLLHLAGKEPQLQQVSSGEDAQYTKIVNVMKANCHKTMSLQELARECDLSVSNMKRIFRRFSDVGIAKYFLSLKIRRAMELLEEDLSASQVAQMLDFSEISYFYTVFKRETGMTPIQYKKSRMYG